MYKAIETDVRGLLEEIDRLHKRLAELEAAGKPDSDLGRFFDLSLEMLCIADTDGHFRRVNAQFERVLGYPREELDGMRFMDLVHPDDRGPTLDAVATLRDQKAILNFVNRYRCKDGAYRWLEWRSAPRGQLIFAAAHDITERMETEERLRLNASCQNVLLRMAQMTQADRREVCDFALEQAVAITGSEIGYLAFVHDDQTVEMHAWFGVARPPRDAGDERRFYKLSDMGAWAEPVRQRQAIIINEGPTPGVSQPDDPFAGIPLRRHLAVPVFDGERIVAVVGVANKPAPYSPADVQPLTLVMDSMWKLLMAIQARQEHANLEAQILQAQKLESLGVLAGGIAHDFNNLLAAILGNASLALSQLPPSLPGRECLEEIERVVQRAADLVRQLLAYAGKGLVQIQPIDLSALVREMAGILSVSVSKKARLELDLAADLPAIEADATQIRQVVMNLIVNASEALGEQDGHVRVTTGVENLGPDLPPDPYVGGALPPGQYVYLDVADTGAGMDAATQARIFDPFFTTKFLGRGLGLAAVLGVVRSHRGTIRLSSAVGIGTTFRILLPAVEGKAELEPPPTAKTPAFRGEGKLLVVDDEELVRSVAQRMVQALGFSVVTASDGQEALAAIQANPDLRGVLLDMTMPRMDGLETFEQIQRIRPNLPVILSSGYNEQDIRRKFTDAVPAAFMQKPYELRGVVKALRLALHSP